MQVKDHKKFAKFGYVSADASVNKIKLGDVVINSENEIGVVLQVHDQQEVRTDMFGNADNGETERVVFDNDGSPASVGSIENLRKN